MRRSPNFWAVLVWLALGVGPAAAGASVPIPRSVLVLDESGGAAAGTFYVGIVSALRRGVSADTSNPVSIFVEHLDLSRFRGADYEKNLDAHLEAKYSDKPIGVIVSVGAGALQYTLRSRAELWPTVPVVFTFVDTSVANELKLPPGVTGQTFRLGVAETIAAARAIVPDLARIVIVGDSFDTIVPYRHFKAEMSGVAAMGLQITDLSGLPIRELQTRLADLPPKTAIVYTAMYSDGEGTYLAPVEALRRFADRANRPIIVTAETQVGQGGTGGFVLVPSAMGQGAASLVRRIFAGESASAIAVTQDADVKPVFDWRQLQRWGVSESRLPPGSEIRFRQLTAWDQYRWPIVAIVLAALLQAALIQWLLYERRMRQRSEAVVRNTMAELAHLNRIATGSELSASIAHEVIQPLTGIAAKANAGLRWLSRTEPDVGKARAMLSEIVAGVHRAADVVRAIRATFQKDVQETRPAQLNDIIMAIVPLVKSHMDSHGIALESDLDERLPKVVCDPTQLQQVVLNLIMNAIESLSGQSGGRRTLKVRTEAAHAGVRVSVEDSGPGVEADALDQIFKPLFTTKPQGMGLGLSICRSIIEAHQGRIWATRREPCGLIVQFELPINGRKT